MGLWYFYQICMNLKRKQAYKVLTLLAPVWERDRKQRCVIQLSSHQVSIAMALKAGQNFLSGNSVHISHSSHGGAFGLATDSHHAGQSRAAYCMDVFIPIYLKPMELGQATASWKLLHSEEQVQGSKYSAPPQPVHIALCLPHWLSVQGWLSLSFFLAPNYRDWNPTEARRHTGFPLHVSQAVLGWPLAPIVRIIVGVSCPTSPEEAV